MPGSAAEKKEREAADFTHTRSLKELRPLSFLTARLEGKASVPSRLPPVLDGQPWNPVEMRDVSGDKHAPVFQRGGGDDEVGVVAWVAALEGGDPEVCRPVEDFIADRVDERVLAEGLKALKLPG